MSNSLIGRSTVCFSFLAITCLAGLLAGCEPSQVAFDRLRLGQPIPEKLPVKGHRSDVGVSFAFDHTPMMGAWEEATITQVMTGADGVIVAKQRIQERVRNAIMLLVTTLDQRRVMEVTIPAGKSDVAGHVMTTAHDLQRVPIKCDERVYIQDDLGPCLWDELAELVFTPASLAGVAGEKWDWRGKSADGGTCFRVRKTSPTTLRIELSRSKAVSVASQLAEFFGRW